VKVIDGITFLDANEVCKAHGISRRTLQRRVRAGQFPQPSVFGGRVYWPKPVVDACAPGATRPGGKGYSVIELPPKIYPVRDEVPAPRRGGWDLR